jgi:hypothetical protein
LQRIRGQEAVPDTVPILPELVIRESTAAPHSRRARARQ